MDKVFEILWNEEGQAMVEYAFIIGLIAIVAIAALTASGQSISNIFGTITTKLSSAESSLSGS